MSAPVCIDISHHQGYPDFEQVAREGVLGVIHKATEGSSYVDDHRAANCSNAIAAGLAISTYHWLSPGSNPKTQMDFYLDTIQPVRGERVVIDYEQDGCTLSGLEEAVRALDDAKMDLQITVYSGHLLKEQLGSNRNDLLAEKTDLWLAQYTTGAISWPEGTYPQWTLWQYMDTGTLDGIDDAYVDFNNFNGNDAAFLQWIEPGDKPHPPPLPPPDIVIPKLVTIDVAAPKGVAVLVRVNDIIRRRMIRRGPDIRE